MYIHILIFFIILLQGEIYISHPSKIYTKPIYFFIKDFILNIEEDIDENDYVKNITGSLK